jgi:hypothetical protein
LSFLLATVAGSGSRRVNKNPDREQGESARIRIHIKESQERDGSRSRRVKKEKDLDQGK